MPAACPQPCGPWAGDPLECGRIPAPKTGRWAWVKSFAYLFLPLSSSAVHFECILPLGHCFSFPFNLFSFGKAFFNSFIYIFYSRRHPWAQVYRTRPLGVASASPGTFLSPLSRLLVIDYWMPSCLESRDSTGKDSAQMNHVFNGCFLSITYTPLGTMQGLAIQWWWNKVPSFRKRQEDIWTIPK